MGPYYNSTFRLSRATHTLSLHRPGLTTACGLRRAKVAAKSWPFPHSTVTMKTSNKLYCIQRSSYRFRITKNKQVNTCFFIETDCAHLPLVGKTESTILEQHTYTSFEIEHACSISGTPYIHTYFELVHACSIFHNTLYTYLF